MPMQPEDIAKNNPEGEPKQNPQQPPKGEPKGQDVGNGVNEWGNPAGRERTKEGGGGDNPQLERAAVDQEARRRAMDLQLDKFKQNVNNEELLKKLNMTKEEYQRFIDGYEKMVKRASTEPAPREDMKTGPRTGSSDFPNGRAKPRSHRCVLRG